MKALDPPVSGKKKFWSLSALFMFKLVTPWAGPILTRGHHMTKLGRGQQAHAENQISKLYTFQF